MWVMDTGRAFERIGSQSEPSAVHKSKKSETTKLCSGSAHVRMTNCPEFGSVDTVDLLYFDQLLLQLLIERDDASAFTFACFIGQVNMVADFTISLHDHRPFQ